MIDDLPQRGEGGPYKAVEWHTPMESSGSLVQMDNTLWKYLNIWYRGSGDCLTSWKNIYEFDGLGIEYLRPKYNVDIF